MQGLVIESGFRPERDESAPRHHGFDLYRASARAKAGSDLASDLRFLSPSRHRHHQLRTSTCVANSVVRGMEIKRVHKFYGEALASGMTHAAALQHALSKHVDLSRLALYFMARELMDPAETDKDEGTYISLAAEALRRFGVCTETEWPFEYDKMFTPPSWRAMRTAYVHKVSSWCKIYGDGQERIDDVIVNLAMGNPVAYGTTVGANWSGYSGSEPIDLVDGKVDGSHATILVGWDPAKGVFIGENSWGPHWGLDGFYEVRPEVVASQDSRDFVALFGGWQMMEKAA